MAKRTTSETATTKRDRNERLPRLTLEALGREREMTIKIDEHITTIDSEYGTSELFHVTDEKKNRYSWFVRRKSGNFRTLKSMFGRECERWEGKRIELERSTFDTDDKGAVAFLAVVEN